MTAPRRSAAQITFTTWKALFLRVSVARLSTGRLAWFWLLLEPLAFTILLMIIFSVLRVRHIGGIDTAVWIMAGVLSFIMFRRTASQGMTSLGGSKALFTHPQIRPIDPVVVNAALEGLLMVLVSIVLLAGATMIDFDVVPADPLAVLEALLGLWLMGVGYALVGSVALKLAPPVGAFMAYILRPLYILSGVILPVTLLPYPYRDWFLFNPLVHGLEAARLGFAPYYRVPPEVSLDYVYVSALVLIFVGLGMHLRFGNRLAAAK